MSERSILPYASLPAAYHSCDPAFPEVAQATLRRMKGGG